METNNFVKRWLVVWENYLLSKRFFLFHFFLLLHQSFNNGHFIIVTYWSNYFLDNHFKMSDVKFFTHLPLQSLIQWSSTTINFGITVGKTKIFSHHVLDWDAVFFFVFLFWLLSSSMPSNTFIEYFGHVEFLLKSPLFATRRNKSLSKCP